MKMKVCIIFVVIHAVHVGSEKRLVLHSEVDIASEFASLQTEISQMKTRMGQLEQENTQLTSRLGQVEQENAQLVSAQASGNSVYIRWGKTSCPGNGTTRVYKGYAAGNHYNDYGGGVTTLCLPDDPTWGKHTDTPATYAAYVYGTEIDVGDTQTLLGTNYVNQDIPCVMCETTRSTSVMIPGRVDCYPGWSLEYTGYLLSGYAGLKSNTDFICIDEHPEGVPHGGANNDEHLMYFTRATCTSLSCPPYVNGRQLACVVCSH